MGAQLAAQITAVLITIAWSGVLSFVLLYVVRAITGLRVREEAEREGLDLSAHGERAYSL
jgi:Amt family ammonium transporter